MSNYNSSKQVLLSVIGMAILIIAVVGVAFAFFNYTRTGTANVIRVGKIAFNSNQTDTINLTNVFPIDKANLDTDTTNVDEAVITITGDTTYPDGIEYLITAVDVSNTIGTGNNQKRVPISISVSGTNLGTDDEVYFDNRGGNTSLYHVLANNVIEENGRLVVGYITSGQTGINGTFTIKAYFDKDRIGISDTYDGTESEIKGTTNEWADGRTILTTTEWNALQTNGVSFKVKVEANEGIWVEEPLTAFTQIIRNVNTTDTINFGNISSASNGQGLYILPGTENDTNPIYYYRGAVTDNNVIFGGFCWQIVRTTETGGIKMIYNGLATDNGTTCTNTTHADRILTSTSAFNTNYNSLADVGYMNNTRFTPTNAAGASGSIYGKDIEWDGNNYLVIEETANTASTNTTKDNDHHYSCGTSGTTTCSTVRYYYYSSYYITLSGGDLLEDAIYKMTGNGSSATKTKNVGYNLNANDSTVKGAIDTWFRINITNEVNTSNLNYSDYLEDTVYCNDRSFKTVTGNTYYPTYEVSGWNPIGGDLTKNVSFGVNNRAYNDWYSTINVPTVKNSGVVPNVACPNETDRFTVSNSVGNGALTYPVGLLTADEIIMAGASGNSFYTANNTYYLYTGGYYWSLSSDYFSGSYSSAYEFYVSDDGTLGSDFVDSSNGVRPVVSLKLGTEFETGGEGTTVKPYVVKYE